MEICVSKSIGLACSGKEIYHFCFVQFTPSTSPPGGLYSKGQFNGGFFALRFWGAYIWKGFYMEGLIFGILRYAGQAFYVDRGKSPFSRKTIIHLIYPSKFCITNFSSVLLSSQKKSKTMVMHALLLFFFGGGGGGGKQSAVWSM